MSTTRVTPEAQRGDVSNRRLFLHWTPSGLVDSTHIPVEEMLKIEERHEATRAESAPLGLFGFAIGTFLIAMVVSGFSPRTALIAVIPTLLLFAGIGQFIAGLLAFDRGSTFGGTMFCTFGAGYATAGMFAWMQQAGVITPSSDNRAIFGLGVLCFAYMALVLTIAAMRSNMTYAATLGALVIGYALASIPYFGGPAAIGHVGGWLMIVSSLIAFYGGGAVVVNSNWRREVWPLGAPPRYELTPQIDVR
jgi:succinate-acetate transporter protein